MCFIGFFEIKCNSKNLDRVIEHLRESEYIDDVEILNIDRKNGSLISVVNDRAISNY